jgi:two-component system, OmpR family, alkaline phosphatase synthesis response regulator PhoP
MSKKRILVVEDETDIRELIQFNLEQEGYAVIPVETGEAALAVIGKLSPDLIVLDLMLPGIDGLQVCRVLSAKAFPILMVTAKSSDADIVLGLEMGAEDYITKPFSPRVLVARVRALLRRRENFARKAGKVQTIIIHKGIEIDAARHIVTSGDARIDLSATEFSILEFLVKNPGWVFSRNQIIESCKNTDYSVTERSVDVQILSIRKKLGEKSALIETVRGIGYRMAE